MLLCACQGTVRLYSGERRPAGDVATIHVRGDGRLSMPDPAPGDTSFEAALVGFDGAPTANSLHKVEVLPGLHTLDIQWSRWTVPSIGTVEGAFGPRWVGAGKGVQQVHLNVVAGKRYWLDWIPEWRTDRPPGPPLRFMTTVDGRGVPVDELE